MLRRSASSSLPGCPTRPEPVRALPSPTPSLPGPDRNRSDDLAGRAASKPPRRGLRTRACNQRRFRLAAHGENQSLHLKEPAHGVHSASSCAPPEGFCLTAAAEDRGQGLAIISRHIVCGEILFEHLAVVYFQVNHLAENSDIGIELCLAAQNLRQQHPA